jgi:hypothetical protein
MGSKRCPFCIAKDDEIGRLHRLVEKLSMRPAGTIALPSPSIGPNAMQLLADQAEEGADEPPVPGAVPMTSFMDEFNAVHGDGAWSSLSGYMRDKAAE